MTPEQHARLAAELNDDPLELGYADALAAGNHTRIAQLLNVREFDGPVPYTEFQTSLIQMAAWGKIRVFAALAAAPEGMDAGTFQSVRGLCFVSIDLLRDYKGATIDMSLPAFVAATGGLVRATLMTEEESAAILGLAANRRGRAEVLIGTTATEDDIARALKG